MGLEMVPDIANFLVAEIDVKTVNEHISAGMVNK